MTFIAPHRGPKNNRGEGRGLLESHGTAPIGSTLLGVPPVIIVLLELLIRMVHTFNRVESERISRSGIVRVLLGQQPLLSQLLQITRCTLDDSIGRVL